MVLFTLFFWDRMNKINTMVRYEINHVHHVNPVKFLPHASTSWNRNPLILTLPAEIIQIQDGLV